MPMIKLIIEKNLSLLLLLGVVLGFFIPSFGSAADEIVIFLTAALIFISCSDIEPKNFFKTDIFEQGLFVLTRFMVFPLVLYMIAKIIVPEFAMGVLLLSLMPAGVAVASLCSMSRGGVILGLSLTIISSLLTPLTIPAMFSFIGVQVNVNSVDLFCVLMLIVVLPVFIYLLIIRQLKTVHKKIKSHNKTLPVLILAMILAIVVASQKHELLNNPSVVYYGFLIMVFLFALYYLFGIAYSKFVKQSDQISYIFGSGAMNNSLAVGLAFAYFDSNTIIFIVLSEVVWSIYIAGAQYYFSKKGEGA